jgi:hypothetical protein
MRVVKDALPGWSRDDVEGCERLLSRGYHLGVRSGLLTRQEVLAPWTTSFSGVPRP